jgi:O-antigen/teichoic acid export membrane protein
MTSAAPPIEDDENDESIVAAASSSKNDKSSFGMDAVGIAVSRFFLRFAGFFSNLIIARLLGAEGRGLISALTTPSQIAVTVSELGIRQSAAFHIGRGIYPVDRVVPTLLAMIPIASLIGIGVSWAYFDYADVASADWELRALAVALIPLALITAYSNGVFLGERRIAEFRKTNWRPAFVSLALLLLLAWMADLGIYGAMIAPIGGAILGAGYALYLVRKTTPLRMRFDRQIAKDLQKKGVSYAASFIVLTLNYRLMILLLTRFSTLDQVGIYAQAILIAELIWEIPNALTGIVLSRAVTTKDENSFSLKVQVLARISFVAAVGISICVTIVAPFIFPFVFGKAFSESASVCIILLPGIVAFIVFKILSIDMAGRGKPWATMVIMVPILIINVVAGWWAIERSAAYGAAAVSSACYVAAAVGYVVLYSRMTKFKIREIILIRRSDFDMLLKALPLQKLGLRKP